MFNTFTRSIDAARKATMWAALNID